MSIIENPTSSEMSGMEHSHLYEGAPSEATSVHEPASSGYQTVPDVPVPLELDQSQQDTYLEKHGHLLEYYNHFLETNNRLRNRIYHVRKAINHLKQLKRVLCTRLLHHNAIIMDSNLEIPDNEGDSTAVDKVIGEVMSTAQGNAPPATKKRKMETKKKEPVKRVLDEAATRKQIISIIDSVVAEAHNDTNARRMSGTGVHRLYDPLSESDLSTDELADRLLRESSIDHLLPETPDSDNEHAVKQEPLNESVNSEQTDEAAASRSDFLVPEDQSAIHSDLATGSEALDQAINGIAEASGLTGVTEPTQSTA